MKFEAEIDSHKLHLHPEKVAQWRQTGDCYPVHVEIGATGRCDHHCSFCALDFYRNNQDIDQEVMISSLKDMGAHQVRSVMFGGE